VAVRGRYDKVAVAMATRRWRYRGGADEEVLVVEVVFVLTSFVVHLPHLPVPGKGGHNRRERRGCHARGRVGGDVAGHTRGLFIPGGRNNTCRIKLLARKKGWVTYLD
jgi:hypothetical protein